MMSNFSDSKKQIQFVESFVDLISTDFHGEINAACWNRELKGDFSEIVDLIEPDGNITIVEPEDLLALDLSEQGQLAREVLLADLHLLEEHGASPVLNVIKCYDRDDELPFFPTDVYSFHVDRSPVPTHTFLCTYHGDASEIVANDQARQKVLIPEIRQELRKLFGGADEDFDTFLTENFFDLHYQADPDAQIINLGIGNLWKLAVDHPESECLPCLHRAPNEQSGQKRLLLIC